MPNPIKYTAGTETLALKKGNFYIGTGDVGKGPSDTTGYYQGISPSSGGYVIYMNKSGAPGDLSYHNAPTDAELISFTNSLSGQSYTGVNQCLIYFAGQTDKVCLNRDYEPIVTDGLVFNLDAGFTPSYPKNGTTWYDLSSYGNNVTLRNGPTFNSVNGGSVVFDGADDNSIGSTPLVYLNSMTIESWIFPTNYPINTGGFILSNLSYYLEYGTTGKILSYFYGLSNEGYHQSDSTVSLNAWSYVNTVRDKENNTILFYINGVLDKTITGITGTLYVRAGNGTPQVGGFSGGGYKFNGRISNVKFYNRALSESEVLQNYNSQKGRFGL
jgi:hypothetical protein